MRKLIIVCSPDLDRAFATDYVVNAALWPERNRDGTAEYFPEADYGYASYKDFVMKLIQAEKGDRDVLVFTRYLEPAINGFVEAVEKGVATADQVEVHLYRPEIGWTVHPLTQEPDNMYLTNHWPIGIFY